MFENFNEYEQVCTQDRYVIPWDQQHTLSVDSLKEAIRASKKNKVLTPQDIISASIIADSATYETDMVLSLLKKLEKKTVSEEDAKIIKYYKNNPLELIEKFKEAGYLGIVPNTDELLNNTPVFINLMLCTKKESDNLMESINNSFGSNKHDPDLTNADAFDNALTYIIHQQGYKVYDVIESLINKIKGNTKSKQDSFIKSVTDEIYNSPQNHMSEICIPIQMTATDFIEFSRCLDLDSYEFIRIKKDVKVGVYNEWLGKASNFGIQLYKDLIIPKSMISNLQLDESLSCRGKPVGEVMNFEYSDDWAKDSIEYVTKNGRITKEDIAKSLEKLKKKYKT